MAVACPVAMTENQVLYVTEWVVNMYVPEHFRESDTGKLLKTIREYGFGLLVVSDVDGIEANHVPFHLQQGSDGESPRVQCHLARANPAWRRIGDGARVLVVFQGPDAYISPSWYASKAETGRVVPTWNYLAVHVEGRAKVIEQADWLGRHVRDLTDRQEAGRAAPWSVDDAPEEYTDKLLRGIVGVEIEITKLTGKLKASQNQPVANRRGVKDGLASKGTDNAQAMAELLR